MIAAASGEAHPYKVDVHAHASIMRQEVTIYAYPIIAGGRIPGEDDTAPAGRAHYYEETDTSKPLLTAIYPTGIVKLDGVESAQTMNIRDLMELLNNLNDRALQAHLTAH